MNRTKITPLNLLITFLFIVLSCSHQQKLENTLSESQKKSINKVTNKIINSEESYEYLIFLILRDCDCVEENILWIEKNAEKIKSNTMLYIKSPEEDPRWKNLRSILDSNDIEYYVDNQSLSERYGFISSTDKLFKLNNSKVIKGFELKTIISSKWPY